MKIKKIDIGIEKIDKIYHISDVHIRNLKRHKEYKIVFQRTVDAIKKTLQPNDIIFLGGDIVHAKTDMTPELVQSVQEFFKMFADLAPTILITGNHDCNLNNKSRLDALTPIVNALNHSNLIYLKDSGVYHIADKHFTVMSVFDKPKDFIKASDFKGNFKIALHHGAVDTAVTDVGFRLVNEHVNISTFEGYDLVLLGDIHKPEQYLNDDKTIAYPGSLIQQGYAEALHHGMLVWDTATKTSEFVVIPNDICYYTLEVTNGKFTPIPTELEDKTIRLRIKSLNTESADLKKVLAKVKTKFTIEEYTVQKVNDFSTNKVRVDKINIGDVRDVEYQNELITKYLDNKFALEDDILDGVRHVNRTVNSSLPKLDFNRNVSWIPKRFEFSNMFSYGPDNVVDFTNMQGVYGIFAPNASGKSTLLDAITFCIFDKCGRTSNAASVLNNKSSSFTCKFNFELDGKNFFIEKRGTKGRGNHVRVDINFYILDELGNEESLNGKERSETNKNIRNILGTYEDFVLTALSVQNNNSGFIDMAQKDRKDLLASFLDINVFEQLYNAANEDIKEVATLVKEYQRQDFGTKLANAINDIKTFSTEHKDLNLDKTELEEKINKTSEEILLLTSKLVPVDNSIEDIAKLEAAKVKAEALLKQTQDDVTHHTEVLTTVQQSIDSLNNQLSLYDIDDITNKLTELTKLVEQEKQLYVSVERLKTEVRHKLDKMSKLDDLKYDENCSFCMDNVFVKDAIATKTSIESDKRAAADLVNKLNELKSTIAGYASYSTLKTEYEGLQKELQTAKTKKAEATSSVHHAESLGHQVASKLAEVSRKIEEYYKIEETIKNNLVLKQQIVVLTNELNSLKESLSEITNDLVKCHSNILLSEKIKSESEDSINKLKDLEKQYKFYQYYLEAVNRDGVPYDLITTAVPFIEQEINNILTQLVDFNLMLEMDGKNINCYIVYDDDNYWAIELTSGMERFISSLAIRTALINVSSLPRPNFLAIDEGFGVLDSDNLNSIYNLFDYLKTQFTFMLVISHIDSMRDVVDKLVEITKTNGSSKIYFE
jgi:DNA repair exonuclease SbcCD ATPase subunit/DNA repair exonuclease SbcCD nuclease subunit